MNTRSTISAGCLVLSMLMATAAETTFKVTKYYLNIPVSHKSERVRFNVEIPVDGNPDNTMWVMYGASGT